MKFLVFSDFHYKKHMYIPQVTDLEKILARAAAEQVDFVIHLGDFCNDFAGSPEIIDTYLHNPYGLPVYGIYGNHDLESGNSMDFVTPRLCNRPVSIPEGERIGHWYTDLGNFRLIGLDTNYSLSPDGLWERSHDNSHCPPKQNTHWCSLGTEQLAWLGNRLADAKQQSKMVLVFSHKALWDLQDAAPDRKQAQELLNAYSGTVLAVMNGHIHTDHFAVIRNIAYWDVNAAHNGGWRPRTEPHYAPDMTYAYQDYAQGKKVGGVQQLPINTMTQAQNTWFFKEPLSAIVTINEDGHFKIEGSKTEWVYGIDPDYEEDGMKPCIEDREVWLEVP